MRRVSKRLANSGALDVISTAVPGIKDILILGKVKQLERSGQADLIVLDAPAAGHAVTFLTSARGLLDAVRVGPVRAQAEDVMQLLTDPARCQVLLVTMPEETPVNEAADTAAALRQRVGVRLGAVVVNGLYPPVEGLEADPEQLVARSGASLRREETEALRAAAEFRARRQELQQEQVGRLAAAVDLPQLHLPFVFETDLGPPEVETLADELADAIGGLGEAT